MNVHIKIEFVIDDVIAWHCIQYLLNTHQKPTKQKVVQVCKRCFYNNGATFETEPGFSLMVEELGFRETIDDETVDIWFEKTWK